MKLWWPHCEAMVAFAYAHKVTQKAHWWDQFCKVSSYTFDHFNDEVTVLLLLLLLLPPHSL